jgi:hypothetical protein
MRGLRLLRSWLSPQQCAQFDAFGYFDVIGGASGKKYCIHFGTTARSWGRAVPLGPAGVLRLSDIWCRET